LKLENVLIDDKGYGKIVDLGFAKIVEEKTFTLVGTPEYLAPEIIMSKGHDKAADYWAFGILIYELICGKSAFYHKGSSQVDMFKRIVLNDYTTPDFMEPSAKDLIKALLTRRQNKRLGNLANGYLDVKNHPWFELSGISYKKILRKEAEAPWEPNVKDPFDASNFDDYSKDEKDRRSSKAITRKQQEVFKGF
jgi:serine/threonine protein kinase